MTAPLLSVSDLSVTFDIPRRGAMPWMPYSIGGVKDLVITGVQTLSFTTGTVNVAAGEYDGTLSNLIQVLCTDATTPTFWITISQPQ